MALSISMSHPVTVFVAPRNEATAQWGVYCIPKMWRHPDGRLLLYLNGGVDSLAMGERLYTPSYYFASADNGETWSVCGEPELPDQWECFTGQSPVYTKLTDGRYAGLRYFPGNSGDIAGLHAKPVFCCLIPNGEVRQKVYRYAAIAEALTGLYMVLCDSRGKVLESYPAKIVLPELLVCVPYEARCEDGSWAPIGEKLETRLFLLNGITQLPDGTLLSTMVGQHPEVRDRQYTTVTLMQSEDMGRTWYRRGTIFDTVGTSRFGMSEETDLLRLSDGTLLCVMRSDLCLTDPSDVVSLFLTRSEDGGYSWSEPEAIADSSVTPHLVLLQNGVVACVYGRPGVHVIFSEDRGRSWTKPMPIIGKTLTEELKAGNSYADCKYWKSSSYSNTQIFPSGMNEFIVCYSDLRYEVDGEMHKAILVRKITAEGIPAAENREERGYEAH